MLQKIRELYAVRGPLLVVGYLAMCLTPGSCSGEFTLPDGRVKAASDGSEWIWNLAEERFPGAIQIVDLYHAREHLWESARKLHPND